MKPAISFAVLISLLSISSAFAIKVDKGEVTLDEMDDYLICHSRSYGGEPCDSALKRWVKAHPEDAFKAGKMTRGKMYSWAAIPFFALAFDRKEGSCKDQDVGLAVVSALNLPESHEAILRDATRIGFDLCFAELKDKILAEATIGSYLFKNVCAKLMARGSLSGLKQKKCQEITK